MRHGWVSLHRLPLGQDSPTVLDNMSDIMVPEEKDAPLSVWALIRQDPSPNAGVPNAQKPAET